MTAPVFRPEQEAIITGYTGGQVGIAAVPGSGKTFTLAHLAARLIYDQRIASDRQEVLVVTFTNSAVNSFQARIAYILRDQYGLLPFVGYRVRTLHGLAHDIVRERPALVGLADDFTILDEKISLEIQRDIVANRLAEWWDRLESYLDSDVNERSARRAFEQDVPNLVIRFIQRAKDLQRTPDNLLTQISDLTDPRFDLLRFAVHVYADYQRSLAYRGAVDFDDLVRLALEALALDEGYLARLRERWPYILEDEAQDSSHLQEKMLRLLSAERNWVRVGDPNQAINTTFTTATPEFLREFLNDPAVTEFPLSVSGRSTSSIIMLANELARWTTEEHPVRALRDAFDYVVDPKRGISRGHIRATPDGDPQPNPPDDLTWIRLLHRADQKITPEKELDLVVADAEFALLELLADIENLPEDERPTIAVLVPENSRGFKLVEALHRHNIPAEAYEELLRSTTATRAAVALLQTVLDYLSDPTDLRHLKMVYWALMPDEYRELVQADVDLRDTISKSFARWKNIEDFLWPVLEDESLAVESGDYDWLPADLVRFRVHMRRWLEATSLPIDQLILTIAQAIFTDAADIALAHKIALLLRSVSHTHPDWRLPQFVEELRIISSNERRFIGFDDVGEGYAPKPGVITVSTMHAAKGL
ncbi:MAG: UvrD-helicase domain-containing protein, partial [Anaerolineae bacterium]|nr:UvrD-helicase domain-containing protein [Anaerolineae bacterium]